MYPHFSRKISMENLADMVQHEYAAGNIVAEVQEAMEAGFLPVGYFRQKLGWVIERSGDEGHLNFTQL